MRTDVRLSTHFLPADHAHQVGLLVTITGEAPLRRPPLNLSLVLDRSGSMAGAPLDTAWGPGAGGDPSVDQAIGVLQARGSTNLSGGWLEGRRHVAAGKVDGVNRILLFTDGEANAGIVDPAQLRDLTGGARADGVATTCI